MKALAFLVKITVESNQEKNTQRLIMNAAGQWWYMPLIPAAERQKQAELCLVNRASSQTGKATQRKPVSKKPKRKKHMNAVFLCCEENMEVHFFALSANTEESQHLIG